MSDTHLTADDLAATLTAFAISLVAALKPKKPNEVLENLANELDDFANKAPDTPAADALAMTARMLMASEPR
ncbi:hypothetical protein DC522_05760 [Microvirga sp. KLBC 81]|uniref:hypothetical protein n=1 Tax=Microvirga sp. KLBC 81 TaxID=1862707 RepID=UPI000D5117E3|nr:hypothetical protein [Microvirga sp. KLBC 81]PVE25403.1 hypothetical protein DC522_05760 [Microvirga sp. KLBC 81]